MDVNTDRQTWTWVPAGQLLDAMVGARGYITVREGHSPESPRSSASSPKGPECILTWPAAAQ